MLYRNMVCATAPRDLFLDEGITRDCKKKIKKKIMKEKIEKKKAKGKSGSRDRMSKKAEISYGLIEEQKCEMIGKQYVQTSFHC